MTKAPSPMTFAIAQINPHVGHIVFNTDLIIRFAQQAKAQGAHCVVFPESSITGYPLDDLLYHADLYQQIEQAKDQIAKSIPDLNLLVGYPSKQGDRLFNTVGHLHDGMWKEEYHKQALPNYSVFDEKRYFTAGNQPGIFHINDHAIGILICEDLWDEKIVTQLPKDQLSCVISINASPYTIGKTNTRDQLAQQCMAHTSAPLIYVNCVGGQDEVVFDGQSMAFNAKQEKIMQCTAFQEELSLLHLDQHSITALKPVSKAPTEKALMYEALTCGVRDYVHKNGFQSVILGLSGGIDSALSCAIACDALGPENVHAVSLPSSYTADMSNDDAEWQANAMGISYQHIPIQTLAKTYQTTLSDQASKSITQQNLQARIRGTILMALANEKNALLLSTSNKSEMSVGYATLYGDMAGAFCVLKDLYKGQVYELARYRNQLGLVIPERVISRPPSAELAPDQCDQDTLPPYPILDAILGKAIEEHQSVDDIVATGYPEETVKQVLQWVFRYEYKRRQAPPGVKMTKRAFGRDRRYPITSGYRVDSKKPTD